MIKNYKDSLYLKFNEFKLEFESDKKTLLKNELDVFLQSVPTQVLDAEDYFIWGLLYYFLNNDQPDSLLAAKNKFNQALLLSPDYYMARLYLAHCFQDEQQWKQALQTYEQVSQEKLKVEYPIWRYIKLREQMGYCYYQLGDKDKAEKYFQEVLEYFRQLPQEEIAAPMEIIACLPEQHPIRSEIQQIEQHLIEKPTA